MKYYLAPLEGITTYIFRNAYYHHFGLVDKYYTPFIGNKKPGKRDKNEILPDHNTGMELIPQILSGKVDEFLSIAGFIKEYGYGEVNLNLGCPSGTVFSRNRGSGALKDLKNLEKLLDGIYSKCDVDISIKTRIGVDSLLEWEDILKVYAKFPIKELIIHTRLREEYYKGKPHMEAYNLAKDMLDGIPLCYNGDIVDKKSYDILIKTCPAVESIMIGRGILYSPSLPQELKGEDYIESEYLKKFKDFHDEILDEYIKIMPQQDQVLFKMKDLWSFMINGFSDSQEAINKIRRSDSIASYKIAVRQTLS